MSTHTDNCSNHEIKKIDVNTLSSWHEEGEFHYSIEQDLPPSQDLEKSIPQPSGSPIIDQIVESGNFPIRYFRLILKKIGLKKMFESISDPRSGVTHYSVSSLLINAFLIFVAGYRSRHAFHSKNLRSKNKPEPILSMNTTKIIGSDRAPSSRTIENLFLKFEGDELKDLLFEIFHKLLKTKVFQNHRGSKTADGYLCIH
jgi:hypothetical protein